MSAAPTRRPLDVEPFQVVGSELSRESVGPESRCLWFQPANLSYQGASTPRNETSAEEIGWSGTSKRPAAEEISGKVINLGALRQSKLGQYINLQSWEGAVTDLNSDHFLARLTDNSDGTPLEAKIPLAEVSEEDACLVELGAIFYWNIGYEVTPSGQRKRNSTVRFRRLPAWTTRELNRAKKEAEGLFEGIEWT